MGKKYTLVIYINLKKKKKMLNTLWLWLNDLRVIKAKGKKKKIWCTSTICINLVQFLK